MAATVALPNSSMPGLYQAADKASLAGQKKFLLATKARLLMAIVAAIFSELAWKSKSGLDVASFFAATAFLVALGTELWLLVARPDDTWYDGRAIAESTKTLAWRFAVRAEPFTSLHTAESELIEQLHGLLRDAPETGIQPSNAPPISDQMRRMHHRPLLERKSTYLEERIADQRDWYGRKAIWNSRRANKWTMALIVGEIVGVCLAIINGLGIVDFDAAGIIATFVGTGVAWLGIKQHHALKRAYTFANLELGIIYHRLSAINDEARWAAEVADAEEAISREHTMWRASRSRLLPNL